MAKRKKKEAPKNRMYKVMNHAQTKAQVFTSFKLAKTAIEKLVGKRRPNFKVLDKDEKLVETDGPVGYRIGKGDRLVWLQLLK